MNSASVSVKDLRKAVIRARNAIDCDQVNRNLRISCNGSATIRFTGSEFSGEISIPCDHFGEDFDFLATVDGIDTFLSALQPHHYRVTLNENGAIACDQFNQILSPVLNSDGSIRGYAHQVFQRNASPDECTISIRDFSAALKFVLPTVDPSSFRYALGSVRFTWKGNSLELTSTDSRRLHRVEIPCQDLSGSGSGSILIPAGALQEFLRITPKSGNVHLKCDGFEFRLHCSAGSIFGRRTEGRFPRVDDIIPPANSTFSIDRTIAEKELKKLQGEYSDENRGVDIYYNPDNGTVRARLGEKTVDIGKVQYHFPTISLDLKFLLESLKGFGPGPVEFSIPSADLSPVRIDSGRSMALIMPVDRSR